MFQMDILQRHLTTQNISQMSHMFQDEWVLINILAGEHFFHSEVGETDFSITPAKERSVLK